MLRFYFLLMSAMSLYPAAMQACGYGFVGNCSTNIGLRINETLDSFAIAPCPDITDFHGLQLGTIQSLSLVHARSINWESCQNNVTGVVIYFRVFPKGMPGGAWQTAPLEDDYKTVDGPYTTRYRSVDTNVGLINDLVVGTEYVLEAFFRADVDTVGDDDLPETFIDQDNDGINYQMSFRYGGSAAPPFVVVGTRRIEPTCYGDSTGMAGVSVYGNHDNLNYHWNYVETHNFNTLSNLPAGVYTVTVTGMGGYSQSATLLLGQPPAIDNQFVDFVPLHCHDNGTAAQITAQASGGTGPYSYQWSDGTPTASLTVYTPGNYTVTETDARGCVSVFMVVVEPFALTTTVQMATGPNSANGAASVNLTGGTPPYSFQWSNGTTTTVISDQLPGGYCVTATDSGGCKLDTCMVISYTTAAWEAVVSGLRILPNPVAPGERLALRLPEQLIGEMVEIEIFDATGRRWWRADQVATTLDLQVALPTQTPAGLLLVRVRGASGQAVGRCVAR